MGTYIIIGGDQKEYGPASSEDLRQWITEGRLAAHSMARAEPDGEWQPLNRFPEFAEALQQQAERYPAAAQPPIPSTVGLSPTAETYGTGERAISISNCLSRSGQLVASNFGLLVGASALVWTLGLVCQFTPLVGPILYMLLKGVLFGGLFIVFLHRIRGEPTSVNEIFAGFGHGFTQLMLAGFVTSFLSSIGAFFCLIPWLFLVVAWVFAVPLVADKQVEFWPAMNRSLRTVSRVWLAMAVLMFLAYLPTILVYLYTQVKIFSVMYPALQQFMQAGTPELRRLMEVLTEVGKVAVPLELLNKLVLLFNLPFATGALMYAYEDLFGDGKTPGA